MSYLLEFVRARDVAAREAAQAWRRCCKKLMDRCLSLDSATEPMTRAQKSSVPSRECEARRVVFSVGIQSGFRRSQARIALSIASCQNPMQ